MIRSMSHTVPSTTNQQMNLAFLLRLSRDQACGQWRILLKPVDGGKERLFGDVEAVLIYLEAVMQNEQR